jgi:ketosteroid isomerase-like protein
MSQPDAVTEDTLKEILEAFNRHDLDGIMSYFADNCTFDLPRGPDRWGTRFVGTDQVRKGLASRFAGIPDVHYGEDRHFVSGSRGASEWRLTGTTISGARIDVYGCDLWEFADGKVLRKDSYWKIVE